MPGYPITHRSFERPYGAWSPAWAHPHADGLLSWIAGPAMHDYVRRVTVDRQGAGDPLSPGTVEGLGLRSLQNSDYYQLAPLTLVDPFTVSWWGVKINTIATVVYQSSGVTTGNYYGAMLSLGDTGAWWCQFADGTGTSSTDYRRATSATTLTANRLVHLVAVCRSAADWTLYIDGVPETPTHAGTGGAIATHAGNGGIGRGGTTFNASPSITLDQRVYSRALSEGEVRSLWVPETRWALMRRPFIDTWLYRSRQMILVRPA